MHVFSNKVLPLTVTLPFAVEVGMMSYFAFFVVFLIVHINGYTEYHLFYSDNHSVYV